jgi:hypothetical protein
MKKVGRSYADQNEPKKKTCKILFNTDIPFQMLSKLVKRFRKVSVQMDRLTLPVMPSHNEFMFQRLNCIQELQLLEVLCDYFTYSGEAVRNMVFMSLFPPAHSDRSRLLIKLVSMASSTKNVPVLTATGIWMQVGYKIPTVLAASTSNSQ